MTGYRDRAFAGTLLALSAVWMLAGCSRPAEQAATSPGTSPVATTTAPTSNDMPPEARARMEATQQAMRERAEAQGRAMMQGAQSGR